MPLKVVATRDRVLNRIVKRAEPLRLVRGEAVYGRRDASDQAYLVREGHVTLNRGGEGGRPRRVVGLAGPGELFGLEAVRSRDLPTRLHDALAGETSVLLPLDGPAVFRALQRAKGTLGALLDALQADLAVTRDLATGSGGPSTRARIATVLLDLAQRLGREREDGVTWIPCRIPHRVLGDLAGAHRSTVTTSLNDWLYDGVLSEAPLGFAVADLDGLRAVAGVLPGSVDPESARR